MPSLTRSLYKLKIARDEIFDTHISATSILTSSEESTRGGESALTDGEPGVGVTDAPAPVPERDPAHRVRRAAPPFAE